MRYPDWTSRLRAAIEAARPSPFAWGGHDCCLAACTLALAVADIEDPALPWRGRYKTGGGARRSLARYLRRRGPGGLATTDDLLPLAAMKRGQELGLARVEPLRAQRGDIVLADAPFANGIGPALAMVDLSGRGLIAASAQGWAPLPIEACRMAWRL